MKFVLRATSLLLLLVCIQANNKCHQSDTIKLHYLPDPFRIVGKASGVLQSEIVTIGLTIETLDSVAADSLNKNSQIVNTAISAFKSLGLTESEFSTNGISVYPSYVSVFDNTTNTYRSKLEGYKVRNSITINTKQLSLAGKIIDSAVQSGVTNIDYITYSPLQHNITKLKEKLLADAVKHATKQARIILEELKYEIVSVKNIQIIDYHQYQPYQPSPRPMAEPMPSAAPPPETQVFGSTDRQEVQVEVQYIIRQIRESESSEDDAKN